MPSQFPNAPAIFTELGNRLAFVGEYRDRKFDDKTGRFFEGAIRVDWDRVAAEVEVIFALRLKAWRDQSAADTNTSI